MEKTNMKTISLIGDSISTLEGYNPEGSEVYYDGSFAEDSGVADLSDTWWGKVIANLGLELLVNDSYSGSTVTQANWAMMYPAAISQMRMNHLSKNGNKPDIILINMGTNDFANGVEIRSNKASEYTYFYNAYEFLILQLREKYEHSEIWLMTLSQTKVAEREGYIFPRTYGGIDIDEYNNTIRELAKKYNCKIIDIYKANIPYESMDVFHPNKKGMDDIYRAFMKAYNDL